MRIFRGDKVWEKVLHLYDLASYITNTYEKDRQKHLHHRTDIHIVGGGLFSTEAGSALDIAGTYGEIQNHRPTADIVIGRNLSRSAANSIGHDLLDVRGLHGCGPQFHRADVIFRGCSRDAYYIFR